MIVSQIESGRYRTEKNRVVYVFDSGSTPSVCGHQPSKDHRAYRVEGTETYGWLPPDYELHPLTQEEKETTMKEEKGAGESKRSRFKRLSEARTNLVLQKIRVLGNCSARAQYEYSEEDIDSIFSSIELALADVKEKFIRGESKSYRFSLK